jgi:paraquat-inducible protein B
LEGIRISLDKVKNLSSSVLGDKLHIVPSDGGFKDKYTLDAINPNETKYKDGLRVVLKHTNSKNISVDTPLYYNYYKIGKVESIALNTNTDDIEITLYIEPKYTKYITDASSFRLSKLIDVELGLVNSKVNIGTLKTLIDGGIDVISPKEYKALAKDGDVYHLSVEDEDSE